MRFPQDFIEKVREANNLVEIIGQYTELKERGGRLWGRCPFPDHNEKTPSFSVQPDSQLYYCFGCKKGGNLFSFLEHYSGMTFPQSIEFLAKRASIPLPEIANQPKSAAYEAAKAGREQGLHINKLAAVYFYKQLRSLPSGHPVLEYLRSRGLTAEILETFRIGVALDQWQGFVDHAVQNRVPLGMLESMGLAKKRKPPKEGYYDLFRERIMFPILSAERDVLGFGGRTYSGADPKYLNSPETATFHKSKVLYGVHESARYIRSQEQAIVVEGYMDAIALFGAGIRNVVAILGTALTADHARLLKRYTRNVIMVLDGDDAGIAAAERSLPILLEADLLPKGLILPDGMDPDDFVKANGADVMKQNLNRAQDLFSIILGRWMRDFSGSAAEKVQLGEKVVDLLRLVPSQALRDLYVQEAVERLEVDRVWLRQLYQQASQAIATKAEAAQKSKPEFPQQSRENFHAKSPVSASAEPNFVANLQTLGDVASQTQAKISVTGAPRDESFLLSLLMNDETLFNEGLESDLPVILSHSGLREVWQIACNKYRQAPHEFARLAASLTSQMDDSSLLSSSLAVVQNDGNSSGKQAMDARRLMVDYMNAIRKRHLKNQAKQLAHQLRDKATPEKMEQFMNIAKDRQSLDRGERS